MTQESTRAFSALPASVRSIWAKSGQAPGTGHGLLAHMLDVAAAAEVILTREPPATLRMCANALGLPAAAVARWMAALAGVHDFGKAIPGFQAKWPDGQLADQAVGLTFAPGIALLCDQHSLATAALLTPLLEKITGAAWVWCQHVVQAVSAHHGYHFTTGEVVDGAPLREGAEWSQARALMLDAYWAALAPDGLPAADECGLPIVNWLAGLTSAADWVASNPRWFPLGERGHDDLKAYHGHALQLAEQALPHLGWHAWRPLLGGPAPLAALLPRVIGHANASPRPLQEASDLLLRESSGPTLLLVEAPMGEGKTELAFLAHLRLQAAHQHRGLYVALPTQATGNALFKRAQTFLEAFASGLLDVQLVHGGAAMSEELTALRQVGELQGVGDVAADTLSANAWFGQRSRPLLSPYGVGTVDQALYAVLNVKHHFVRLWGLSNRVVVFDEVHAYDTYTSGLIDTLLRWLKALHCSVVLMSATLPRARSRELLRAWGVDEPPPDFAYPRLLMADSQGVRGTHVGARPLAPIRIQGLGSDVQAMAALTLRLVADGGCGALIVNTVSRAQALYRLLKQHLAAVEGEGVELLLFHARFPADERQALEKQVSQRFGQCQGERPARALLVATQVAEQSLDIDFDFMLSDLAPVDLLLQRAGRLHRHDRPQRPSCHRQATLWVAGLLPDALPDMKGTAWGFVYEPYILGRTWAILQREAELQLPADIDRLVQAVYDRDHELSDDLDAKAREFIDVHAYGEYRSNEKVNGQLASNIVIDPAAEAHLVYDGKPRGHGEDELGLGLTNTTRQGQESVTVVPVVEGTGGLWHVCDGDVGFDPEKPLDVTMVKALYSRQLKVSRRGLVKRLVAQPTPPSFAAHAMLRHMRPVLFRGGRAIDQSLKLSLSREMGLMYENADQKNDAQEDGA